MKLFHQDFWDSVVMTLILVLWGVAAPIAQSASGSAPSLKSSEVGLVKAIYANHEDVVFEMLRNGANVNQRSPDGETPLYVAVHKKNQKLVSLLLQHGANVNAKNEDGRTPLHEAMNPQWIQLAEFLIDRGASADTQDKEGKSPLHLAAKDDQLHKIVKAMLEGGANSSLSDRNGSTPLHHSANNCAIQNIEALVERGVNIEARDKHGDTPLHMAVRNYVCRAAVRLLLQKGSNINSQDDHGWTPLHVTVRNGQPMMAKLLLQHAADPSIKTKRYRIALSAHIPGHIVPAGTSPIGLAQIMKLDKMQAMLESRSEAYKFYRGATLKGRVYDMQTGLPVKGAEVKSTSDSGEAIMATTGTDGAYLLAEFEPRSPHGFRVEHPEYHPLREPLHLNTDHVYQWDFQLVPKSLRHHFTGRIFDARTLNPISGAMFRNVHNHTYSVSDSDGKFSFSELPDGRLDTGLKLSNDQRWEKEHAFNLVSLPFQSELYIPCLAIDFLTMSPDPQIKIIDLNSWRPIAGARVRFVELDKNYFSDSGGLVKIEGLPTSRKLNMFVTFPDRLAFWYIVKILPGGKPIHEIVSDLKVPIGFTN